MEPRRLCESCRSLLVGSIAASRPRGGNPHTLAAGGVPAGWARFTHWWAAAPPWPIVEDPNEPGGSYFSSVADLLAARMKPEDAAHALGDCSCATDYVHPGSSDYNVECLNRDWWSGKESVSEVHGVECRRWRPQQVRLCDCEETDYCECEFGMLYYPGSFPPPHGAG
jgi:hypothetical protein